jgi:hypothetical protein
MQRYDKDEEDSFDFRKNRKNDDKRKNTSGRRGLDSDAKNEKSADSRSGKKDTLKNSKDKGFGNSSHVWKKNETKFGKGELNSFADCVFKLLKKNSD